jgi:hypothetical protein
MRDRLIGLIRSVPKINFPIGSRAQGKTYQTAANIADHLLANGVIVPPCKVGDTVYFLPQKEILQATVTNIEVNYYTNPQMWLTIEYCLYNRNHYKTRIDLMLGKTVFLTREEAEKALAERSAE